MTPHYRERCYRCFRPKSSCVCAFITPLRTDTKFVILMHTHEFKKIKNNTGRFTHLQLENSALYVDTDFKEHTAVNALINDSDNNCYVLYPCKESLVLDRQGIAEEKKQTVVFIIDATWHNAKKLLRDSPNLQVLPKISFEPKAPSKYQIKEQPMALCLSTIESVHSVLSLLVKQGDESLSQEALDGFLLPFEKMVEYQLKCSSLQNRSPRFKAYD